MLKGKAIEQVIYGLCGGIPSPDQRIKYDERNVELRMAGHYDEALINIYTMQLAKATREGKGIDMSVFDNYIKSYDLTIIYKHREFFVDFPEGFAPIPNYIAVRNVVPLNEDKEEGEMLHQIAVSDVSRLKNMAGSNLFTEKAFYFTGHRLKLWNWTELDPETLRVEAVSKFDAFDDEDDIELPVGQNGNIIDLTIRSMSDMKVTPEKKTVE